tara:strand:- start:977 stop:1177 length:201 start_codon:yes stop_codon:yes gene_type:complete
MCLICVELSKNKLTSIEARRNLGEFIHTIDEKHAKEVWQAIWDKEDEERETNNIHWYEDNQFGDTD